MPLGTPLIRHARALGLVRAGFAGRAGGARVSRAPASRRAGATAVTAAELRARDAGLFAGLRSSA
eukprot:gene3361-8219_t